MCHATEGGTSLFLVQTALALELPWDISLHAHSPSFRVPHVPFSQSFLLSYLLFPVLSGESIQVLQKNDFSAFLLGKTCALGGALSQVQEVNIEE